MGESQEQEAVESLQHFWHGWKLLFLFPLFLVAVLGAGYGHYIDPGPGLEKRDIVVPHGGARKIACFLQKEGFLAKGRFSRLFFYFSVLLTSREGELHAAEFTFPAHASIAHILSILRYGMPVAHHITIAEGLTAKRITSLLLDARILQGDVPDFPEGGFFPGTFSYTWGMKRAVLVQKAENLMNEKLHEVWEGRDRKALEDVITTPRQLLILASLIERESSLSEERPLIARVFINRLRKGMRLQTDPTVIYALSEGQGRLDGPLTHNGLSVESPYNTYRIFGLPPGPICSPGLEALRAAAHPADGIMLYFVASGHGGHRFAGNLDEQNANIRAYRAVKAASVTQ